MGFLAAIRSFKGVPWVHHGRDEKGLDCIGFMLAVYRLAGIDLSGIDRPYGVRDRFRRAPAPARALSERFDDAQGQWRDGDVLVVRVDGHACHVAVVGGEWAWAMGAGGLDRMPLALAKQVTERALRLKEKA